MNILPNSLQRRLILAATAPLLMLTLLLTAATLTERDRNIVDRLQEFGGGIAIYLASVSDFALYSSDRQLLNTLVSATMRQEGVTGIAFLDSRRLPVVSTFEEKTPLPAMDQAPVEKDPSGTVVHFEVDEIWYFQSPVWATYRDTEDYGEEEGPPTSRLLGWVVVALDPAVAQAERQGVLVSGIGIAVGILAVAVALSYLLSRNILKPISQLTETVKAIESGDYTARAPQWPGFEVDVLAQGINHMAQSIADSRTGLQREVSGATAELQRTLSDLQAKNRELEVARQSAEDANAAKTDFLARMSHELRTPLNSIHGFVDLLQNSHLDESELLYCRIIDQAAHLLLQLIDDILVFTRLQAQATELELLPMDFYQCLEDPVQLLAPMAHDKQLELILDIAPDTPRTLVADSRRLRQIITNLLSNAIKFTEQGSVLVRTALVDERQDDYLVSIMVRDTGIGIPDQRQKFVFDAFNQADSSISRRFGGTGLGLAIVKALTDLMGGSILLESRLGKGSEITVHLPLEKDLSGSVAWGELVQPLRVCVYDPRANSRQALGHLLSRFADRVDRFADIPSLRAGVEKNPPDRILINVAELSAADPAGLVSRLSVIRQFTQVPIVVTLTLKQMRHIVGTELEAELQPALFLSKPPTMEALRLALVDSAPPSDEPEPLLLLPGVNVLVAEDNEFSQLLIATILRRARCNICMVGDGQEAIVASRRQKFDVIIVDGHMPELDGWETLRAIRAPTNPNHETPAILLTADVLTENVTLPAGVGIRKVMHKPFEETELLRAIADLSGKSGKQAAPREPALRGIPKEKFHQQVIQLLDALAKANSETDMTTLRELAHQLLGIAGVFKLDGMGILAADLHAAVKSAAHDRIAELLEELARDLEQFESSAG